MRTSKLAALGLAAVATPLPGGLAQASGGGGGSGGGALHLVPMDEITVPIIDADRMAGSLNFKLVLEAGSNEIAIQVLKDLPVLRATSVEAGLEFARLNASGLRAVDAEQLDHDLTAAIKAAQPGITRVLIVEVRATPR